jgi:acyl carrier protein
VNLHEGEVALTADEILELLQRGFDEVKGGDRTLALSDDLTEDLKLDSLDAIDLMSALEEHFPSEVIDEVVDSMDGIRTVGDLANALSGAAEASSRPS